MNPPVADNRFAGAAFLKLIPDYTNNEFILAERLIIELLHRA